MKRFLSWCCLKLALRFDSGSPARERLLDWSCELDDAEDFWGPEESDG